MAWTAPVDYNTGDIITASIFNDLLGSSGNIIETAGGKFTTAGDTIYADGANSAARLGIGSANEILAVNSGATAPEWVANAPAASDITGWGNDKILYTGNSGTLTELALGASGEVLTANGATSAPTFAAAAGGSQELKAWMNYQNIGTPTIKDSYNVTSVTDGSSTAETAVLWDTDFASTNYAMAGLSEGAPWGTQRIVCHTAGTKLVGGVELITIVGTNTASESPDIGVGAWGDQ